MSGQVRDRAQAVGRIDRTVLALSVGGVLAVVAWGVLARGSLAGFGESGLAWVIDTFGWFFVVAADAFLVLSVIIATTRFGRIRLGADDDEPEFSTLAWVAMMFSAGMGIGLVFFAVAEPIQHYAVPPPATGVAPQTGAAGATAMQYTLFHWTLHPWGIYAVVALALAYSTFRRGRENRISAAFHPCSGTVPTARPGGRSTCWPSSPPCSARRRASASARSRSPPVSTWWRVFRTRPRWNWW